MTTQTNYKVKLKSSPSLILPISHPKFNGKAAFWKITHLVHILPFAKSSTQWGRVTCNVSTFHVICMWNNLLRVILTLVIKMRFFFSFCVMKVTILITVITVSIFMDYVTYYCYYNFYLFRLCYHYHHHNNYYCYHV